MSAPPRPAAPPWLENALRWAPASERPIPSQHLARAQLAEVRVNPEARDAYLGLVADTRFAEGTLLLETLFDAHTGQKSAHLALHRDAQGWSYAKLSADGRVESEGQIQLCSGCHGMAPDRVFGLPRPPARSDP